MLAKLIVHAEDRDRAIARAIRALQELRLVGVSTSVPVALRALDSRRRPRPAQRSDGAPLRARPRRDGHRSVTAPARTLAPAPGRRYGDRDHVDDLPTPIAYGLEIAARSIELCQRGDARKALAMIERAAANIKDTSQLPPRTLAAYGLALALGRRRSLNEALGFCHLAVQRDMVDPQIYYALGRVYLTANRKAEAIRALETGIRLDPGHRGLRYERSRLGVRAAPVLSFVGRGNVLNRVLGRVRHSFRQGERPAQRRGKAKRA